MTMPGLTAEALLCQTQHHFYRCIADSNLSRAVIPQLWMECKRECNKDCADTYNNCLTWCGNLSDEKQQNQCASRCDLQYERCDQFCGEACDQKAIAEMIDEWESEHPGGKPPWEYSGALFYD